MCRIGGGIEYERKMYYSIVILLVFWGKYSMLYRVIGGNIIVSYKDGRG